MHLIVISSDRYKHKVLYNEHKILLKLQALKTKILLNITNSENTTQASLKTV